MRMGIAGLIVGVALVAAACGPTNERGDLERAISTAVAEAGDGGTIDMASVADLDWGAMYAFSGYTTDDEIDAAMGIAWGTAGDESRIPYDGQTLVTFVKDGTVVAWSELNQGGGPAAVRFGLYDEAIPRSQATFRVAFWAKTIDGRDIFVLTPVGGLGLDGP